MPAQQKRGRLFRNKSQEGAYGFQFRHPQRKKLRLSLLVCAQLRVLFVHFNHETGCLRGCGCGQGGGANREDHARGSVSRPPGLYVFLPCVRSWPSRRLAPLPLARGSTLSLGWSFDTLHPLRPWLYVRQLVKHRRRGLGLVDIFMALLQAPPILPRRLLTSLFVPPRFLPVFFFFLGYISFWTINRLRSRVQWFRRASRCPLTTCLHRRSKSGRMGRRSSACTGRWAASSGPTGICARYR